MTIINLVRESRKKEINKNEIWQTLLQHRWDIAILKTNPCFSESQVSELIFKTVQDLKIKYDWNLWIPEDDIRLGTELYSVLHYCPENLVETAKLSKLFESIITKKNLNTVVAATMHNTQPRAGDKIKDFTAINMWYQRLDERYNFSLGPNILPLMTTNSLTELAALDPPFLHNYQNITDDQQGNMPAIAGTLFSQLLIDFSLISNFRQGLSPSEPPTSFEIQLEFCVHPILRLQYQP